MSTPDIPPFFGTLLLAMAPIASGGLLQLPQAIDESSLFLSLFFCFNAACFYLCVFGLFLLVASTFLDNLARLCPPAAFPRMPCTPTPHTEQARRQRSAQKLALSVLVLKLMTAVCMLCIFFFAIAFACAGLALGSNRLLLGTISALGSLLVIGSLLIEAAAGSVTWLLADRSVFWSLTCIRRVEITAWKSNRVNNASRRPPI